MQPGDAWSSPALCRCAPSTKPHLLPQGPGGYSSSGKRLCQHPAAVSGLVVRASFGRHCLGIGCVWLELPSWNSKAKLHHSTDDSGPPIEYNHSRLAIPDLARMASLPTAVRSTSKIARKALQQRSISDVAITRTGKPILRVQGGRSVKAGPTTRYSQANDYMGQIITRRYELLMAFLHSRNSRSLTRNHRAHRNGIRRNGTAWTIHC